MRKRLEFEGFCDLNSGWEFDMPVFLVSPIRLMHEAGSASGGIEEVLENYMLNLDLKDPNRSDKHLDKAVLLAAFESAKKRSRRYRYWSASVEYDTKAPAEFSIVKKRGFK
jgi:hypothetical protein